MAESHAKLHLRSETTKYDAVVAIWLLEESFQAMYGIDISNPSPQCTYDIENVSILKMVEFHFKNNSKILGNIYYFDKNN